MPFGLHDRRCADCGQRMKRSPWLGFLWDASGVEDDRFFKPKTPAVTTWDTASIQLLSSPETHTVSSLLQGKLDREFAAVEPVTISTDEHGWIRGKSTATVKTPVRTVRRGVKQTMAEAVFRT